MFYKKSKNEFDDGLEAVRPDEIMSGQKGISHSDCQDVGLNEDYDLMTFGAGPSRALLCHKFHPDEYRPEGCCPKR